MSKWLRRAVVVLALAYPLALILVALLLRYRGESWWATGVGLYLPRIGFAAPLPFLVLLILVLGPRKLLWTQLAAALLVLFPLMGLVLSLPRAPRVGERKLRILSFNVDSGFFGSDKVAEQIRKFSPDIALLQEVRVEPLKFAELMHETYPTVVFSGELIVASRFPILDITAPERMLFDGRMHSRHSVRYLVDSPLGKLALYQVHTTSPRSVFYELWGRGLKREILSGHIFSGWAAPDVQENNGLRAFQIEGTAEMADKDEYPVILAGDTNLPGLSHIFGQFLSHYQDGFEKAGAGFGYTFGHGRWQWMRIDRILASDHFRFLRFDVGCPDVSDHLCVVADLERGSPL